MAACAPTHAFKDGAQVMSEGLMTNVDAIQCKPVEVHVGDRGVERAVKHLKRKMAAEGILRELKRRRHYMKPSVRRRKKAAEASRRRRKRVRQPDAM